MDDLSPELSEAQEVRRRRIYEKRIKEGQNSYSGRKKNKDQSLPDVLINGHEMTEHLKAKGMDGNEWDVDV